MKPSKVLPIFLVVLILLGGGIATVWLRLSIIRTTYSISETERQIKNAVHEKEKIALKYSASKSPRRLEGVARTKFGFQKPDQHQVVYLK